MKFEKGHEKIAGSGRAPGTTNKNTEIRNFLRDFMCDNREAFCEAFARLPDRDKCVLYLKAAEYVLPKLQSVQFEDTKEGNSAIVLLRDVASYNKGG